ncbi:hypothetical protein AMTR_s00030p00051920 [Amborella trichopoda]|uniref:Uncharacterized protein n=1 Tax=Amborella trichopoda TaxID=13333 RepID=U5CS03_AMBTC|nr:hypothetical protein AMTR_s00030p00051920 [Amborella trichopoda]
MQHIIQTVHLPRSRHLARYNAKKTGVKPSFARVALEEIPAKPALSFTETTKTQRWQAYDAWLSDPPLLSDSPIRNPNFEFQ